MNSPLPFFIASPPFLRRYIEPSSPRSTRYILFSPIITSFYYFFFAITIHRLSRLVSLFLPLVFDLLYYHSIGFTLSLFLFLSFHFSFFFSFSTITHCFSLSLSLGLRDSLSPALSFSLRCPPSPSCCVFSCFFLL